MVLSTGLSLEIDVKGQLEAKQQQSAEFWLMEDFKINSVLYWKFMEGRDCGRIFQFVVIGCKQQCFASIRYSNPSEVYPKSEVF